MHSVIEERFFLCTHPKKVPARYAHWRNFFWIRTEKKPFFNHLMHMNIIFFIYPLYPLQQLKFALKIKRYQLLCIDFFCGGRGIHYSLFFIARSSYRIFGCKAPKTLWSSSFRKFFAFLAKSVNWKWSRNKNFGYAQNLFKLWKKNTLWNFPKVLIVKNWQKGIGTLCKHLLKPQTFITNISVSKKPYSYTKRDYLVYFYHPEKSFHTGLLSRKVFSNI